MSSIFSGIHSAATRSVEQMIEMQDPKYVREKREIKEGCLAARAVTLAVLVTSVALAAIGAAVSLFVSTGSGMFLIITSLPAIYLSYNGSHVLENMDDVIDNPLKYKSLTTGKHVQERVKEQLLKNTFFCEPIVDFAITAVLHEIEVDEPYGRLLS